MAFPRGAACALLALLAVSGLAAVEHTEALGTTAASPRGVHLSLAADATSMVITWFTDGLADPGTVVEYGTTALDQVVTGTATPVEPDPEAQQILVHEAVLAGLTPGTTYQYRVGGGGAWSTTYAFTTADGDGSFRVAVFGDHGTDDPEDPPAVARSTRTTATVLADGPDLVVIVGDLSYANGRQPVWDLWFTQLEPLAARVPVMPAIGNHEWEGAHGTAAFRSRLALPGAELYYSFDYERVHFLMLQSHTEGLVGDVVLADMAAFAEADLQKAAARRAAGDLDFIAVVQHHPPYSNEEGPERRVNPHLVALEEQWFIRYGVDLLLVGHDHYYDRSRPMVLAQPTTLEDWDYVDPIGTLMVVTGGGGRSLYDFTSELLFYPWSAAHAKRYHFVRLDFDPLHVAAAAVGTGLGAQGEVFDAWTIAQTQSSSSTGNSAMQPPRPFTLSPSGAQ